MRNDFYIAKRLFFSQEGEIGEQAKRSRPAVRVALLGMIIGVLVMIITIFVVVGFKEEVRDKVVGFGAHIQVVNFDNNNTYEMKPIAVNDTLIGKIAKVDGVADVWEFATKPGMIKTTDAFQAIVLKGSTSPAFFAQNLVEGQMPKKSNEVLISTYLANLLQLDIDSTFLCYFVQSSYTNAAEVGDLYTGSASASKLGIRVRKYVISGLYNTDFLEYDQLFVIGDIKQIQHLNGWDSDQVSGIEVMVTDFDRLDEITNRVYFRTANQEDARGGFLYTQNIRQTTPMIFSWLDLLDMNVIVIIVLMLCVSGICMCSGLIILILEGVQFVGVMKALGANNQLIRRVYLWQAAFLIGRGMLIGNVLGLTICALQYFFHFLPLDPSAYYVSYVPIAFAWGWWGILNIGTFIVSMLIMLAPSALIARIAPAQVMRFE